MADAPLPEASSVTGEYTGKIEMFDDESGTDCQSGELETRVGRQRNGSEASTTRVSLNHSHTWTP